MRAGRRVEQHLADLDVVDSIDQAQVRLGHKSESAVFQALHQIDLPQRSGSVESPGEHPTNELAQLGKRAWPR